MYEELDKMIVEAAAIGASPIYSCAVFHEANRIQGLTGRSEYRIIDGRLQALRKRGLIRFKAGKWEVCK